jgi:hypothetical protein
LAEFEFGAGFWPVIFTQPTMDACRAPLNDFRVGTPVSLYRPAFQSSLPAIAGLICLSCSELRLRRNAPSRTRMSAPPLISCNDVPDRPLSCSSALLPRAGCSKS